MITIGLILVPAVYLGRAWLVLNKSPLQMNPLGLYLLASITIVSFTVAYGVWKVRRWGFYALVIFGALTAILDLYTLDKENFAWNWWFALDIAAALAGVFLIFQEEVRKPYFDPNIRWWETANRIRHDVAATLFYKNQKEDILILDISATGCFSEVDAPLEIGQEVKIKVMNLLQEFESEAIVVRKNTDPSGYGLKFKNPTRENRKILKKILRDLENN